MIVALLVAGLSLEAEVARLGDPVPAQRKRARIALMQAGERAVPALHGALRHKDPDVVREAKLLLDHNLDRRLAHGVRRNKDYKIPRNKMTRRITKWRRANVRAQLLQPKIMKQFGRFYRGVLEEWHDPTLADYHALLGTLTRYLDRIHSAEGIEVYDAMLAAKALAWKLGQLRPGLGRTEWTTKWLVRRRVLPALLRALATRRPTSTAEAELYESVCGHVRPLCDTHAERLRESVLARIRVPITK